MLKENSVTRLLRCATCFPVYDVAQSAVFYECILGFRIEYIASAPSEFAIVSRDGLAIMFRKVAAPSLVRPNEVQGASWDAFFWIDDADSLYTELSGRGAVIAYDLVDNKEDGKREFAVRDRDGHVLGFGQPIT